MGIGSVCFCWVVGWQTFRHDWCVSLEDFVRDSVFFSVFCEKLYVFVACVFFCEVVCVMDALQLHEVCVIVFVLWDGSVGVDSSMWLSGSVEDMWSVPGCCRSVCGSVKCFDGVVGVLLWFRRGMWMRGY